MASGKHHVGGAPVSPKATLAFRQESLLEVSIGAIEEDAVEDLLGDFEQRDASTIATDLPVSFAFAEIDDGRVLEAPRNLFTASHLLK
ncbi:hypothetical protein SprV_0501883200 [Sparganum proliferum]